MSHRRASKAKAKGYRQGGRIGVARRRSPSMASSVERSVHPMLHLQQTLGNRTVNRLIQAKLQVGPSGDAYEQEADRVSATIMRTPSPVQQQTDDDETIQAQRTTSPIQQQSQALPSAQPSVILPALESVA
ncbi:MAG: hypothetical protein AAGD25_11785 [Cyanobacteria bacterium P01_F01_bin.150]